VASLPAVRSPRWAWWISLPLALVGLADSIYLTIAHYSDTVKLVCSDKGSINCAKVTTSSQSEIFGHIPVAVTGLIYFVVAVGFMTPWAWNARQPIVAWLRIAGVTAGLGMVVYLVYVEAFQLKAICLYCTGVHVITFLLFLTVLAAYLLRPLDPMES
jgi:uncharacterized membrane protein